jgi:hypothetical protein
MSEKDLKEIHTYRDINAPDLTLHRVRTLTFQGPLAAEIREHVHREMSFGPINDPPMTLDISTRISVYDQQLLTALCNQGAVPKYHDLVVVCEKDRIYLEEDHKKSYTLLKVEQNGWNIKYVIDRTKTIEWVEYSEPDRMTI